MYQKREKGFTLIELLAVIVILAIIALIAVPVIMNIINKANKSAFKDTAYGVISAGELYFAERQLEPNGMSGDVTFDLPDTTKQLVLKGEVPKGTITITEEGKISIAVTNGRYCATKGLEEKDVTITEDVEKCKNPGEPEPEPIMTSENACITSGTCSQADINAGILVNVKVNNTQNYDFYVIADTGTELTLLMSENLGGRVNWYKSAANNSQGPENALAELTLRTNDWTNIPEKTYTLSGLGEDKTTRRYEDKTVTGRARLITYEEANNIKTAWMFENLHDSGNYGVYGYWTSTAYAGDSGAAWIVYYLGYFISDYTNTGSYGIRPVITLSK